MVKKSPDLSLLMEKEELIMEKSECVFCYPPDQYRNLIIKRYNFWTISLHTSQRYLGRSIIFLNRHEEDHFQSTNQEREELFDIQDQLWQAVVELFGADRPNLATFGNEAQHYHWHFIPRYTKPVDFEGITFVDERPGKNYSPYNELLIPETTKLKIVEAIKSHLG